MTEISSEQRDRILKIASACQSIYKATRDVDAQLYAQGFRFPEAVHIVLSRLQVDTDTLFLLLKREDTPRRVSSEDEGARNQNSP